MKLIEINKKNLAKFIDDIRFQDKKELMYFFKDDYRNKFIKTALENKENSYFLADENDNPLIIGGVQNIKNNKLKIGCVWLLSSNYAQKHRLFLYKYVKNKITLFKKDFDVLFNYIYKSNFDALKWLKKCGFSAFDLDDNNFKLFYFKKGENNFDIRNITCK